MIPALLHVLISMARKEKQAVEKYETPILSAIYKGLGDLTIGVGLLRFFLGFSFAGNVGIEAVILVFAGITLFGIAQVITFIGEIAVNTRVTANNSSILAAKRSIFFKRELCF